MKMKMILAIVAVLAIAFGFWMYMGMQHKKMMDVGGMEGLVIPEFSQIAQTGRIAFEENCAACHGINAVGTQQGPSFLHMIYKAGHHGDGAFYNAAKNGVRAHHWPFGNMPPVQGISDDEIGVIIKYVRELQAANGF